MKKIVLVLLTFCLFTIVNAQPWSYNFGSNTASYNGTNNASSINAAGAFAATPLTAATIPGNVNTYARIGTGSGTVSLENQTIAFGSGSYLKASAPSGTSLNFMKFAGMAPATSQMYLSFLVRLGSSSGASDNTITTGSWSLMLGSQATGTTGATFTNLNASSIADAGPFLRFTFGASGAITFTGGASGTGTPLNANGVSIVQATDYTIEIFANNAVVPTAYTKSGTNTLATNTYDVWVNGTKANAANVAFHGTLMAMLDSWLFYGQSSTTPSNNAANIFLDNFNYSNSFAATPVANNYFYSGSGDVNVLTNWTVNTDGSGSGTPANNPTNFTDPNLVFNIRNGASATIGANWVVNGAGSKIIVGDGSIATNFTIPLTNTVTGLIDVANNGTLTLLNSTTAHTLGILNTGSTVNYASASAQTIAPAFYSNLIGSGVGGKSFPTSGSVGVNTSFTPGTANYTNPGVNGNIYYIGTTPMTVPTIPSATTFAYNNIFFANPNLTIASDITIGPNAGAVCNVYESVTIPATRKLTNNGTGAASFNYVMGGKTLTIGGELVGINVEQQQI